VAVLSKARAEDQVSEGPLTKPLTALRDWVRGQGGQLGAAISELPSKRALGAVDAERPLNPASNVKVLTAAVALAELGPGFRYTTGLYGDQQHGRVETLVLRGHGDPSLTTRDLWRLVAALAQSGLAEVGSILVDQSRFDAQFVPPGFAQQPNEWATFRAPVSAIALDRNTVTLHVVATTEGAPATLWFEPPGFVTVKGQVKTGATGSGQRVTLRYRPDGGRLVAEVGGSVAQGLPRLRFQKRVDDPRALPGFVARHLLETEGVRVTGSVKLGGAEEKHRLVYQQSEPLAVLLPQLGKNSDNFYAETLLKTLGAEATNPATSEAGAQLVRAWLEKHGAWGPNFRLQNGSGLFDANRISARAIVRVLETVYADPALYPDFLASLAVGGVDGTLRSRFRNLGAGRLVRAKTGTLDDADALSGYVLRPNGNAVAFSFLVNQVRGQHAAVRAKVDQVVRAIASA
jgi:D-alanyl-D-alanine carboxypeptidase/D-alanyl-D-alanine-endopeptidase (penicillin-binding protein 4)